jgi:hypothetical protein
MKSEWKTFIEKNEISPEFLYPDEFLRLLKKPSTQRQERKISCRFS